MTDYLHTDDFLRDFAEGDPRAFKALFDEYFPRLTVFGHKITRDYHEGEDIASEVLTNCMKSHKRWVYGSFTVEKLGGHLFLAARNKCIDYLRSFRNKIRAGGPELVEALEGEPVETAEEGTLFAEIIAKLYEGLRELPREQQRALELIFYENKSYKEAAEAMGVPLGTFKHIRKGGIDDISRKLSRYELMTSVATLLAFLSKVSMCLQVAFLGHC